ncbi:MAG: DNA gyrase inhibitor YacG [Pseudomonadota bacterium]
MVSTITCPTCKKPAAYSPENPYRPFCSERCKLVDLGQWFQEGYRVPDKHCEIIEEIENND